MAILHLLAALFAFAGILAGCLAVLLLIIVLLRFPLLLIALLLACWRAGCSVGCWKSATRRIAEQPPFAKDQRGQPEGRSRWSAVTGHFFFASPAKPAGSVVRRHLDASRGF